MLAKGAQKQKQYKKDKKNKSENTLQVSISQFTGRNWLDKNSLEPFVQTRLASDCGAINEGEGKLDLFLQEVT